MAAERDQAGEERSGMSRTGRDTGPIGDRDRGSAEVHTGLHSGSRDEHYSGLQFAAHEQSTSGGGRLRGVADAVRDHIPDSARSFGSRASGATAGVRDRLSGVRERANEMMEKRGLLDRLRENPLPVLGVAFALGFLLSGREDEADDFESSRASRMRRELRAALVAGVGAGVAQGARGFLGQASTDGGNFLTTLLDNLLGGNERGGSRTGATGRPSQRTTGRSKARSEEYGSSTSGRPPSHHEY